MFQHVPRVGWYATLLGLVLGLLALGPALAPGYILVQDMVFVPDPVFSPFTFGLSGGAPRAVPSDAVVTALAVPLPAWLVQKLILLAVFALGCAGAALLVPGATLVPRLVAGAFYVWNPYVAERLLMGQWALLLGYAGLPWVVRALCARRLLAVALLPAAVGGFAAMTVTAVTALPVAALLGGTAKRARAGAVARVAALLVAFSLPWLVTGALRPGGLTGDPAGVDAFAARADGPFGALGSLLSLGGIWNAYAVPAGYDTLPGAVARLAVALAGIAGFWLALRGGGRPGDPQAGDPQTGESPYGRGLAVAAGIGFAVAALGVSEAGRGVLKWLVGAWGGFAVFRDAQQFVAPLALLVAVGLGVLTGRVVSRWAAVMVVVPLAVLPTLAWGAFGGLAAVPYPESWFQAREIIRRDPVQGDVLVLPFESYRRFAWNGGRATLDPAQRFFAVPGREVVVNDSVRVGRMVVGTEDPRAQRVGRILGDPRGLAAEGIRYVVVDAGAGKDLPGARMVLDMPELRLFTIG